MKARVKSTSALTKVRSAGIWFNTRDWQNVPRHAEAEILRNPYLETDTLPQLDAEPDQPAGPIVEASKMLLPPNRRGRKV